MIMHSRLNSMPWESHVQAFMDDCRMTREKAKEYVDTLAGLALITVTDRLDEYRDAGAPDYAFF